MNPSFYAKKFQILFEITVKSLCYVIFDKKTKSWRCMVLLINYGVCSIHNLEAVVVSIIALVVTLM